MGNVSHDNVFWNAGIKLPLKVFQTFSLLSNNNNETLRGRRACTISAVQVEARLWRALTSSPQLQFYKRVQTDNPWPDRSWLWLMGTTQRYDNHHNDVKTRIETSRRRQFHLSCVLILFINQLWPVTLQQNLVCTHTAGFLQPCI